MIETIERKINNSLIIEWNKLDHNIRNSSSFNVFCKNILKFVRPSANSFLTVIILQESNLSRLRLALSHLRQHNFKHSFQDSLNPLCSRIVDIKTTAHYFLHCSTYIAEKRTLLSTIENIENNLPDLSELVLIKILLFDSNSFDTNANTNLLNATIEYVLSTKRLFQ